MSSGPDLARTQKTFWDLVTAPEGVASSGAAGLAGARSLVRGDDRLDAVARLDIYANMYFYRLRDCLAEDFPKLAAVLGGARFHNLVTDYLLEHPSCYWSLRELGRRLPAFLERHALSKEVPYLPSLAELEWARYEVFDLADAEPIARERIAALDHNQVSRLELTLIPACRLLSLDWSVADAWRAVENLPEGQGQAGITSAAATGQEHGHFEERPPVAIETPKQTPTHLRVWRRDGRVYHRGVASDERACLAELRQGATLARVGEIVVEDHAAGVAVPDDAAVQKASVRRMRILLELWLEEGLLMEATSSPRPAS